MEMKYVVALILTLVIILVGLFIIAKSSTSMGGLFGGLRNILGV